MYVSRDKDGDLYLYKKQPVKYSESWQLCSDNPHDFYKLDSSLFPEVKWKDEEPTEVELVKKGKAKSMCLKDKAKVCNLCHECDVYVLNPSY